MYPSTWMHTRRRDALLGPHPRDCHTYNLDCKFQRDSRYFTGPLESPATGNLEKQPAREECSVETGPAPPSTFFENLSIRPKEASEAGNSEEEEPKIHAPRAMRGSFLNIVTRLEAAFGSNPVPGEEEENKIAAPQPRPVASSNLSIRLKAVCVSKHILETEESQPEVPAPQPTPRLSYAELASEDSSESKGDSSTSEELEIGNEKPRQTANHFAEIVNPKPKPQRVEVMRLVGGAVEGEEAWLLRMRKMGMLPREGKDASSDEEEGSTPEEEKNASSDEEEGNIPEEEKDVSSDEEEENAPETSAPPVSVSETTLVSAPAREAETVIPVPLTQMSTSSGTTRGSGTDSNRCRQRIDCRSMTGLRKSRGQ
ncbi:hypothetical protein B0H66DRAFT_537525 [Apodospora peruviana]|uniref:Uncharacterized protein n=1 Tax=Apodospora peruviana TaxID=516989 RepID=A0AAE0HWQ1_9PEZI|nr:hypothetical protein B0H66DRAFT_537525 [Apodospora peruviana]